VCLLCRQQAVWVDYKDLNLLRRFINDRGRIRARGATGTCAQHQRDVAAAVKTARELVLLPYVVRTVSRDAGGGRGGGRRGNNPRNAAIEDSGADAESSTAVAVGGTDDVDAVLTDRAPVTEGAGLE
jgi:small subunit ribosomal protein S18